MRLMFVYFIAEDAGSAQDVHNYFRVAQESGHEVVLYGWPNALPSFSFSRDVASADALIFLFEWTTQLRFGDQLDLSRLLGQVPRERRFVIDCDGAYNERIKVKADYNHRDVASSRRWIEVCDSLADKIYQPTLHPLRPNVRRSSFMRMTRRGRGRWTSAARNTGWSTLATANSAGGRCTECCGRSSRSASGSAGSRWSGTAGTLSRHGRHG